MKDFLYVALGGALGSVSRFGISRFALKQLPHLPIMGTLVVNIIGCLLIGILTGYSKRSGLITNPIHLTLIVGFCGGFTTFSAFSLENFQLFSTNNGLLMSLYLAGSLVLCFLMVMFGIWAVEKIT